MKSKRFILRRPSIWPFILFFSFILMPFHPSEAQEHGDLIRAQGDTKIYLIYSGQKRLITTEQVFGQMGFKMSNVKELDPQAVISIPEGPPLLSREIIAPFPDRTLIRLKGTNQTYLIQGGKKCFIPDLETLQAQGYQWDQAVEVDKKTSDSIFTGIPIASVKPPYQYTPPGTTAGTKPSGISPSSPTSTTPLPGTPDTSPSYFTSSLQDLLPFSSPPGSPSEHPYDSTYYPTDPGPSPESPPPLSLYRRPLSIIRIDPNRLTVRDEKGRQTVIGTKYAHQFRPGQRVVLKDNMLVKLGSVIQPECIIIKFERYRVTVSRDNDATKTLAVGAISTKGLNIGDKVWVQNCQLSVMEVMPIKMVTPTGIITWIRENKVVVAQEKDQTKTILITVKNPSGLWVGDRVKVEGCELIKVK